MKKKILDWVAIVLTVLFSIIYWSGISGVPFHPDESTYIFMSSDVELFFQQPSSLAWTPGSNSDPRQQYRLLDAPLTRDLIGIGRLVTGLPALKADWNWSLSWDQNSAAGALPSDNMLQAARFSVVWLFPLSLMFTYLAAKKLIDRQVGLIALVLLAANALVLLHTRRAMAESVLLFTVIFAFWGMVSLQNHPWLTAIPIALAFAAKHSTAGLILVGMIVVIWRGLPGRKILAVKHLALYLLLFLGITFLLNPFMWADPIGAVQAAISARQDLLQRQVAEYTRLIPGQVMNSFPERALGMISNLYFTPLQFAETGNYLAQTQDSVTTYLSYPLQDLMRSFVGGGILFFLTLAGAAVAIVIFRKQNRNFQISMGTLLLSTLATFIGLIFTVPLAFQRYVMPQVPFAMFWTAYAIYQLIWKPAVKYLKPFLIVKNEAHYPRIEE